MRVKTTTMPTPPCLPPLARCPPHRVSSCSALASPCAAGLYASAGVCSVAVLTASGATSSITSAGTSERTWGVGGGGGRGGGGVRRVG